MIGKTLKLVLITSMLFASYTSFAQEQSAVWKSAYYLGRGNTGIATADEEEAIFYNPAGLAQGKGIYKKTVLLSPHLEFSEATKDLGRQINNEGAETADTMRQQIGKPNHFGAYNFTGIILRRAAIGVFSSATFDTMVYKSPVHGLETVDLDAEANAGATFSLAESFWKEKMLMGFTYKYLAQRGVGGTSMSLTEAQEINDFSIEDVVGYGSGSGFDFGLMFKGGKRVKHAFGVNVQNVGNTTVVPTEETNVDLDLKQTVNLGYAGESGTKYSSLRFLVDYHDATGAVEESTYKRTHLGAELTVREYIGITGGLNQGYWTFGAYADIRFFRIDLGVYTEEIGERAGSRADTRYFMKLETGF